MRRRPAHALIAAFTLAGLIAPEEGHAAVYATEFDPVMGSVVDITAGGDFSGAPRFVTNLQWPGGMCVGPNGDLYITEAITGTVKVITQGGDASQITPYATGLVAPTDLLCTPNQILVTRWTQDTGAVIDITGGGDFSGAAPFASGLPNFERLFRDSNNTIWATIAPGTIPSALYDITAGGDFSAATPFVTGPVGGMAEVNGQLWAADVTADVIRNITAGGGLDTLPVLVSLTGTSLVEATSLGVLANDSNTIVDITNPAAPVTFATGVNNITDIAELTRASASCGDGVTDAGEACDDMGESATCDADCTPVECGDGTTNATAGEGCDDGNVDDGDGCSADCLVEMPGTGGMGGAGGMVSTGGMGGMPSSGGAGGTASGAGGAGGMASGGGDAADPAGDADTGCGCHLPGSSGRSDAWLLAIGLGVLLARRRRR